jgi:hypothetical protein
VDKDVFLASMGNGLPGGFGPLSCAALLATSQPLRSYIVYNKLKSLRGLDDWSVQLQMPRSGSMTPTTLENVAVTKSL